MSLVLHGYIKRQIDVITLMMDHTMQRNEPPSEALSTNHLFVLDTEKLLCTDRRPSSLMAYYRSTPKMVDNHETLGLCASFAVNEPKAWRL